MCKSKIKALLRHTRHDEVVRNADGDRENLKAAGAAPRFWPRGEISSICIDPAAEEASPLTLQPMRVYQNTQVR